MNNQREVITIPVQKLDASIELPTYAHDGDSGMDIRANEDITIYPQETVIVPTGLKVAIPDGYEIQVRPRSGLSLKTPLRIPNNPGTIDAGYRDELGIIVHNSSIEDEYDYDLTLESKGNLQGTYIVKKGDRIAQIVLQRVPKIQWLEIEDITKVEGVRGSGFGSSGIK
jgi:dUTP pyrophosphatase